MAEPPRGSAPAEELRPSPMPPAWQVPRADLPPIGHALKARVEEVRRRTTERAADADNQVDAIVQQSFQRISRGSTTAVARWIAGESLEVVRKAGRETWETFGELAAHRAAPLNEVTRRSFVWRNVMAEVLQEIADELGSSPEALAQALGLLQLALEFSLLRMCECFESERRSTDEQLAGREQELSFMATHDALSGLPNRTLIIDRVEQMLARSARSQGQVAALFVDLDNFKTINDTLGHSVGDQLLQAVAARLHGVVRQADALGRLGGDEFVVIAEEDSGLLIAPELIAERLLEALKQPFRLGVGKQIELTVSASIGIATGENVTAEELLRNADIAMYRAKWDGKNGYAVFETHMQDTIKRRMELEMDLRAALANEEFFLAYQPTFTLGEMTPTGVEALIRWRHPTRGVVQPDDFIPLVEENGLIREIGSWVLREACAQGASWRRAGHAIAMSVNVSACQLDQDRVIEDIETALGDSGLPPEALTIEITETALMRDIEETARRLHEIKALGVRIAIDDFGTGYSSLGHLRRFPVDALKIDRSFIAALRHNEEGQTLVHTLVALGKALSIETFAEGIEHEEELALLRAEDCDSGQGFLFARPLDRAAAEAFLDRWSSARAGAPTLG